MTRRKRRSRRRKGAGSADRHRAFRDSAASWATDAVLRCEQPFEKCEDEHGLTGFLAHQRTRLRFMD